MINKEVFSSDEYPEDNDWVLYYFTPFEKWYCGRFVIEDGIPYVSGKYGFTTWHSEVGMWMRGNNDRL